MPGITKSDAKKKLLAREAHNGIMARAISAYQTELRKPRWKPHKSARTICKDFETLYLQETGKLVHLSHSTLTRLASGGRSRAEADARKSWLTQEEIDVVSDYIIETANRGFPLSHRRLKEHVNEICRARLGSSFPVTGVGKNWTQRFVERHSSRLKTSWSHPLETKRGRAVNPNTNAAYFDLLADVKHKFDIEVDCTYGVDEVGCQASGGENERVIGGRNPGPQYQVRDGNRENITVLVTICADGTSTPPAVIFKGSAYQVKWLQDNPANAL